MLCCLNTSETQGFPTVGFVCLHVESLNKNEKRESFVLKKILTESTGQLFMRQHNDTWQIFKNAIVFSQTSSNEYVQRTIVRSCCPQRVLLAVLQIKCSVCISI